MRARGGPLPDGDVDTAALRRPPGHRRHALEGDGFFRCARRRATLGCAGFDSSLSAMSFAPVAKTHSVDEARAIADRVLSQCDGGDVKQAIALAEDEVRRADGEARAVLQHALAKACNFGGSPVEALRAAAAARDGFRAVRSRSGELDALIVIGTVMRAAGDHASAIRTFEDAEPIARALDDQKRLGIVYQQIGVACSLLGRHQQAISHLEEAAELHTRGPIDAQRIATLLSLYNANNRWAATLPAEAPERHASFATHLERWRRLAEDAASIGQTRLELMALGNRAIVLIDCGRCGEALADLAALLPRYHAHGMRPNEAICFLEMGRANARLGDPLAARAHYTEAIARCDGHASNGHLAEALAGLADVEEAMGNDREALVALRRLRALEAGANAELAHREAAQRELRIELARLSSQWHRLASVDALTGLGNRRALDHWFTEVRPRIEVGEPVIVLLHDMDHFKSINDRHGHGIGDEVLRRVAALIQANCRPNDLAVRYGGEEFVLATVGVDPVEAVVIAERLRASVEAHDWDAVAAGLVVTISVGVAGAAETADTMALMTLADRRLYAAKHGGRNRVVHVG